MDLENANMKKTFLSIFQMSRREKWVCSILIIIAVVMHFYGFAIVSYIRHFSWSLSTPDPYVWRDRYEVSIPDKFYLSKDNFDKRSLLICSGVTSCGDSIYVRDSFTQYKPDKFNKELVANLYPNGKVIESSNCQGNGSPCFWVESSIDGLGNSFLRKEVYFINRKLKVEYVGSRKNVDGLNNFIKSIRFKE